LDITNLLLARHPSILTPELVGACFLQDDILLHNSLHFLSYKKMNIKMGKISDRKKSALDIGER
jgi:hypothetical protein